MVKINVMYMRKKYRRPSLSHCKSWSYIHFFHQSSPHASSFIFCLVTIRFFLVSSWFFSSLEPKVIGNFNPIPWAISLWAVLADVFGLWRGGSRSDKRNNTSIVKKEQDRRLENCFPPISQKNNRKLVRIAKYLHVALCYIKIIPGKMPKLHCFWIF